MKCQFCDKEVVLPYQCPFCNGYFCVEHRLPENHMCPRAPLRTPLGQWKAKKPSLVQYPKEKLPKPPREEIRSIPVHVMPAKPRKPISKGTIALAIAMIAFLGLSGYFYTQMISLQFQVTSLTTQASTMTQQINDLRTQIEEKDNQIERIGMDYQHLQSEHDKLVSEHNSLSQGYDSLQIEYKKLSEQYETIYNSRYEEGYDAGYILGVTDGAGRSYNIRDPTYLEALQFISTDQTDKNQYVEEEYTCVNFATDFKNNAFKAEYRCGLVYIEFPESAHTIVCFNTTDQELIFIEPQDDELVIVTIGQLYFDRTKYEVTFDDKVVRFMIVW